MSLLFNIFLGKGKYLPHKIDCYSRSTVYCPHGWFCTQDSLKYFAGSWLSKTCEWSEEQNTNRRCFYLSNLWIGLLLCTWYLSPNHNLNFEWLVKCSWSYFCSGGWRSFWCSLNNIVQLRVVALSWFLKNRIETMQADCPCQILQDIHCDKFIKYTNVVLQVFFIAFVLCYYCLTPGIWEVLCKSYKKSWTEEKWQILRL